MLAAGFSLDDFSVAADTITYTGSMQVSSDLDISTCDLKVTASGLTALNIHMDATLKAKTIEVFGTAHPGGGAHAITNNGKIITDTITSEAISSGGGGAHALMNYGEIEANSITTNADTSGGGGGAHGLDNTGTINANTMTIGAHNFINEGTIITKIIKFCYIYGKGSLQADQKICDTGCPCGG